MSLSITIVKEAAEGSVTVSGIRPDDVEGHPAAAVLAATKFEAKLGSVATVSDGDGVSLLVGLGSDEDRTTDGFRTIGGAVARAAADHDAATAVDMLGDIPEGVRPVDAARAFAEGLVLGNYTYTANKSEPETPKLATVAVVAAGGSRTQAAFDEGAAIATAQCVTRDLVNEPGGSLTPTAFAKKIERLGAEYGFDVDVLDVAAIRKAKMGGLLGVNRGSEQAPRFVELRWTPQGTPKGTVALVGKGITFDSGGLSLKPSGSMLTMKCDMGGAGAVVGAFCALSATQPKVEVRGYLPLTDNMTGGDATRLGDVLTISNGKTVEIHNTDAEGRLVLADGLVRASAAEPDAIVDLATLTGACMVALGADYAGLFGTNESWTEQVSAAAAASGDEVWPLPLPESWRSQLDSDVADMKNIGGGHGGASTAALFLKEFVGEGIPWCHIDIAGPAFVDSETTTRRKGGTGYGVRLLVELLRNFRKPR